MDVILSSGFLAFARHLGFLDALGACRSRAQPGPGAIVGTSSGAVVGALYAAGLDVPRIAALISSAAPIRDVALRPRWRSRPQGGDGRPPWSLLVATAAERRLRQWLPETFDELPTPLAVGVQNGSGGFELLSKGALVPALVASFSVPGLLAPVQLGGEYCSDGGAVDRTGVEDWRRWRPQRRAIVHEVARSRGAQRPYSTQDIMVVRTPRARANFLSFNDFYRQMEEARAITRATLAAKHLP